MLYKIVVHFTHANKANYIFAGNELEIFHGRYYQCRGTLHSILLTNDIIMKKWGQYSSLHEIS